MKLADIGRLLSAVDATSARERRVRSALEDLTRLSPHSFRAWERLGRHTCRTQTPSEAVRFFERAAGLYPLRPALWLMLADARSDRDRAGAVEAYSRALEVNRVEVGRPFKVWLDSDGKHFVRVYCDWDPVRGKRTGLPVKPRKRKVKRSKRS